METVVDQKKNISSIIFSFDRAMQLDAVLRSFYLHCTDHDLAEITVLYKVSEERFHAQYLSLVHNYPQVRFVLQENFQEDVMQWITAKSSESRVKIYKYYRSICLFLQNNRIFKKIFNRYLRQFLLKLLPYDEIPYLLFLVDDNIFIQDFSIQSAVDRLMLQPDALGFSLRLGKNTAYCYPHRANQTLPEFIDLGDQVLLFNWTKAEGDFGYPLEISSSIYRTKQFLPLLLDTPFDNPNTLEGGIASQTRLFGRKFPLLLSFEKSVTFCNPINVVQKVLENRAGSNNTYSAQSLAQLFDSGKRINVKAFNQFIPNGCHQEVELTFLDNKF